MSSRYAFQSPSVTDEKGAYRMLAPRSSRPGSNLRHQTSAQSVSPQDRKLIALIATLALATLWCFGTAYYLFTTRWSSYTLPLHIHTRADVELIQIAPAYAFDHSDLGSFGDGLRHDSDTKFLAYLPHSGFHNQRIAFENALVLSRLFNRTLLVPPVRLGNKPIRYLQFDKLRRFLILGSKEGMKHCPMVPKDIPIPAECLDYSEYTFVPWELFMDLNTIKTHQPLLYLTNFTTPWLDQRFNISERDTLTLHDSGPYEFRFLDTASDDKNPRYLHSLYISDLAASPARLLQVGTLFGSSRLRLRQASSLRLREDIRRSMAFKNAYLDGAADAVHAALGGMYLGAHIRVGDRQFKRDDHAIVRRIWRELVYDAKQLALDDVVRSGQVVLPIEGHGQDENAQVESTNLYNPQTLDYAIAPVPAYSPSFRCQGKLHTSSTLVPMNIPLFVATDSPTPGSDPLLAPLRLTFPCTFFLSDFPLQMSILDRCVNPNDGVQLLPLLMPVLDAMVLGRAQQVVGTDGSTFSAFVKEVLWRRYHGDEMIQQGQKELRNWSVV